jgi:hypothetical protein
MWKFENQHWNFDAPHFSAKVDVNAPGMGLMDVDFNGHQLAESRFLQCRNASDLSEARDLLADHYVREDDLVATYAQSPARANRKQVYWRRAGFLYDLPLTGIELIFSMQTQRLDGDPGLVIRGEFGATKMFALVDTAAPQWREVQLPVDAIELPTAEYCGAFAFEVQQSQVTYAQVLDPSDFLGGRLIKASDSPKRFVLSLPVFGTSLEKGVIRRGRATGIFLEAKDSLEGVTRFYNWYRNSPPPLTT